MSRQDQDGEEKMMHTDILARLSSLMGWQAQEQQMRQGDILARMAELQIGQDEQEGRQLGADLEKLIDGMTDPESLAFEIELDAFGARLGGWPAKATPGSVTELEAETSRLQAALHYIRALTSLYLWYKLKGWQQDALLVELAALQVREQPQEPGYSQDMTAQDREAFQALLESFGSLLGGFPAEHEAIDEAILSDPVELRRQLAATHFMRAMEHLYWLRPTKG